MVFFHILILMFGAHAAPKNLVEAGPKTISIDNLSLEQKVGQLFIFGFPGYTVSPAMDRSIKLLKPGAFLLFGRNIQSLKQTAELNAGLQQASLKYSQLPPFLAVDQEGGAVARIHTSPGLPSAYTIGNTNEPTLAFQAGKVTGQMLNVLGFNMNLAPVLDITDDKLNSFVGSRGFSDSPHKISTMGVAFAQGLAESKVIPVAKHFPGHGPISLDTHQMAAERKTSYTDLLGSDLVPFVQFANTNINSGIMVAHISFPNIDRSNMPATYSYKMITEILTQQLKFKGLIMTDDIEMAGASGFKRVEDRAIAAIKAGNDLIMVGWSPHLQKRAVIGVIEAVNKGVIPMDRINQSVKKILALKADVATDDNWNSPSRHIANTLGLKAAFKKIQYSSVFNDIVASYFKELPGLQATAPMSHLGQGKLQVISSSENFTSSFRRWIKNPNVTFKGRFDSRKPLGAQDMMVYHLSSFRNLDELRGIPYDVRKKMIIINSHTKARVENPDNFLDVIEVYSNHPNLGGYTAEAINKVTRGVAKYSPLED